MAHSAVASPVARPPSPPPSSPPASPVISPTSDTTILSPCDSARLSSTRAFRRDSLLGTKLDGATCAPAAAPMHRVFVAAFMCPEAKKLSSAAQGLLKDRSLLVDYGQHVSIAALRTEIEALNAVEHEMRCSKDYQDSDKIFVAKYKTHLIKALETYLTEAPDENTNACKAEAKPSSTGVGQTIKWLVWCVMAPMGVVKTIFYSTADAFSMLVKCVFLPNLAVVITSFVAGVLKAAIFYMFEVSLLTGALGLKERRTFYVLASLDTEQIEAINHIQQLLVAPNVNPRFSDLDELEQLSLLCHEMHESVIAKSKFYDRTALKERWYHQVVKWVCMGVGMIMEVASVYFAVTYTFQLITAFTAFSTGFSVACPIVIVVFSIMAVGYFLAMSGKSTLNFYHDRIRMILTILDVHIPDFLKRGSHATQVLGTIAGQHKARDLAAAT